LARWIGYDVIKIRTKHTPLKTSSNKTPSAHLKIFFSFLNKSLHESLQGLNSSLAQSAAELWLAKVWPEMANYTFCETFRFLSKMSFWAIILVSDMLERQSRALKTRRLA